MVRNFRFLRTEEDAEPLKIASYRPGDTVWARFDITGYKMGPGNQRDVAYTLTVTRADGKLFLPPGEPTVDKRNVVLSHGIRALRHQPESSAHYPAG